MHDVILLQRIDGIVGEGQAWDDFRRLFLGFDLWSLIWICVALRGSSGKRWDEFDTT